jgi:ABC-2 type transport system permease protein
MRFLAVAGVTLRRIARDRRALLFMLALPVAIIVIIGVTLGGVDRFRVGIVATDPGPVGQRLVAAVSDAPALRVTHLPDESRAATALRRGEISAYVLVPAGLDGTVQAGKPATVPVVAQTAASDGRAAQSAIDAVVARQAAGIQAADFALAQTGGTFAGRLATADAAAAATPAVAVTAHDVNGAARVLPVGFSYSTPTMLVLFVFINALTAGGAIAENRRLGVYERALAAPVSAGAIIGGETLAYFGLALAQSVLIVGIGSAAFGVGWGAPAAAAALILLWALVSAGAGVLCGTLFRTPEQANAIGPAVGIALGMLGGCMWPLAIVGSGLRTAGHFAPQSWAVDAWTALLARHGGLGAIGRELAVLAGFAVVLLVLAAIRLQRSITA